MRMILAACAVAAAGLTAVFVAPAFAQRTEGVAVIVNDEAISTFDVRQRTLLILLGRGAQPTPELQEAVRGQALRDLVDERLKLQEARARGLEVADEEVDRRIAQIAQQSGVSPQVMRQQFASVGLSMNTLRTQIRADIAWRRLAGGRFSRRVRVSEQQVDQELERLKARITRPAVRVAEILLPAETEAEIELAKRVGVRIVGDLNAIPDPRQRLAGFAQAARQVSSAATAAIGGDRDWAVASELPKELQPAVETMLPGQIVGPLQGPGGVYLIVLIGRRDGVDPAELEQFNLREVSVPQDRRADLERISGRINGCQTLDQTVRAVAGVEVEDLGDMKMTELSAGVRDRLSPVATGKASAIYGKQDRAAVMVICARGLAAEGFPTRDQIRDDLFERSFEILADRYLRDLRREAYIRG
jgi:peptidyl-prolyl cis-trans isomerase SurA